MATRRAFVGKTVRVLGTVLVLCLVGLVLYVLLADSSQENQTDVVLCRRGTIREFISERGMTRLPETVLISMPFNGRIEAIPWREGTEVKKGQVLARVVPADVENMLAEARAVVARVEAAIRTNRDNRVEETALQQAQQYVESMKSTVEAAAARANASEARYNYAETRLKRVTALVGSGAASQDDVDRAELASIEASLGYREDRLVHAALSSLQAATNLLPTLIQRYIEHKSLVEGELQQQLAEAQARLKMAEENARRAVMTSPYDGVVLHRFVSHEQFLTAGTPLLEIGRWEDLEVEADILTEQAVRIRPGMPVDIFLGANEDVPVCQGRVSRIYPAAFTKLSSLGVEEQRVKVIVALTPETIAKLRERYHVGVGYRVRVHIITQERANVLIVPRIAVVQLDQQHWAVWTRKGGVLRRQPVQVGVMNDREAEIQTGLSEGDEVVLTPMSQ
ncbi:MAG: HlyD family efflux transporter periplasmic adaptor subunit [Thermogutta sp.]|uniref:efflux RND transporter periplasmic adaptor subunit n=1 Tax=Thermogutta sp. TaxID=1962930 RepID=UPI00198D7CA8|nr:HlyD family efflux transporter periplasmic adaptor subunit [Thermogutta sp.]MBC7351347.1 HlyD family efflux transporter periplasmic adaptor subunit [Thermogutta sp.]